MTVTSSKLPVEPGAPGTLLRFHLNQALEHAGKLYDELTARKSDEQTKQTDAFGAFRELCMRKIMIETLTHQMTIRNVLPVTLNTLSNLFTATYIRLIH